VTESWESHALSDALPVDVARRMCARRAAGWRGRHVRPERPREGADRGLVGIVVWSARGADGGVEPVGTATVRWPTPDAAEATLTEVSWPRTRDEADLWRTIEELAGQPIPR
jgi:hypothetical protein